MTAILLLPEVNWKGFQGDSGCEHTLKFSDELMTSARPVLRGCVESGGKACTHGPSCLTLPGSLVPTAEPSAMVVLSPLDPFNLLLKPLPCPLLERLKKLLKFLAQTNFNHLE